MKYVSIGMMAFTIIMGFMLPSAMGVYWFIGGVMSMLQTLITQLIMAKAKKRK
jgi:membrane protein insertase Oxa1/YidC/SpoIIIJ